MGGMGSPTYLEVESGWNNLQSVWDGKSHIFRDRISIGSTRKVDGMDASHIFRDSFWEGTT